ncbi:MAG: zinc-binding dehydrogenase [Candidatus Neomarinimicrobiota bacterium]
MMRVLRLHGKGDLRLHTEPDPVAGPDEAVVLIHTVGICGSDLHWVEHGGVGETQLEKPMVLGHEFSGVVNDREGQPVLVAVDPAIPCGQCRSCQEGHPNLCWQIRFAGYGVEDGAFREQMAWPKRCLHPLPEKLTATDGALLEPLGVALHAVDLGSLKMGMKVGVFGCGPIGLLIVRIARLMGASQVISTDILPHRLEVARELGATTVLASPDGAERAEVWATSAGEGVDVAFEVAGENAAVETAVASTRAGGSVVLVGIPGSDITSFQASTARRKGLTIKLSRRMKHAYPRAIGLVEQGLVDVRSLVTHRFQLEDYAKAFAVARRREGLKVVIELAPPI